MRMLRMRAVCSAFLVLLLGVAALSAPAQEADGRDPLPVGASLVFLTKSDACDCVANLCVAGEQAVLNFLGGSGTELRYRRVDLTKEPAAVKTYRAVTLPVALLLDGEGGEIARFDTFFTEAELSGAWQQYRATRGRHP